MIRFVTGPPVSRIEGWIDRFEAYGNNLILQIGNEIMDSNPYTPRLSETAKRQTRPTRWMILSGGVALSLAFICLIGVVVGMMWSFDSLAGSGTTGSPTVVASRLDAVLIPSVVTAPLALVGVILLILGFVRRQPV